MSAAVTRTRSGAGPGADGGDGPGGRRTQTGTAPTLGHAPAVTMPLQRLPKVSQPGDPFEREAAAAADQVVSGQPVRAVTSVADGTPAQRVAVGEDELQRVAVGDEEEVQRVAVGQDETDDTVQRVASGDGPGGGPVAGPAGGGAAAGDPKGASAGSVAATLRSPGTGSPISPTIRPTLEDRLGVDLSAVAVHTGPRAEAAADRVQARAFTFGSDIFLGRGESPRDLGLMAHETTHAAQQGALGPGGGGEERVQQLPRSIASRLADYARHIPGYTLFTVVIGVNPLTGDSVARTAHNLVGGLLGLVPFGTLIFDKLVELGVVDDALAFVEAQLARFDLSLARIERTLSEAWDAMDFIRLDPIDYNIGVLVRKFGRLLADAEAFAASLVDAVVELIREAAIGVAEGLLADEPAWSLIKKVLHHDPLRDEPVEASTADILADFLLLIGREQELEQMRVRGTLEETAAWLDTQLETFQGLVGELGSLFSATWEAIQPANLADLRTNLAALATRTVGLLRRAWDFAWTVAAKVLEFVKDALLGWLSDFAHDAPGFHLLTVILGRNPFTGEAVPRSAENLIRGFITLLPGGGDAYEQLAATGVIGSAAATIEGALNDLGISWGMVTELFLGIWNSLGIDDLIDPIGAFQRIRAQFGEPVSRLFAFIRVVLTEVISLILQLMNFPSQVLGSIIENARAAYVDIKNDPVQFLLNLLATVKEGFSRFLSGIFDHLLGGLTEWLFRGLRQAGVEPPTELSLESVLNLVMQVLGLTMERMWEKLAERIGPERVEQIRGAVDRLEGLWTFVRDVQERGPAAIWEHIRDRISGLWDTILQQARDWVMQTIVERVTARLLSMLDPTGIMAVVNGFVAFFNAVQSAVEYIRDLLDIVDQWVGTLAAVARGDVEPGAARLEQGLIAAVPVAIGFLANQVGLGNIGDRIEEIIGGLREMVDQALDWLLDQAERLLQQVMSALGFGAEAEEVGDTGDPEHDAAVAEGLAALATLEQQHVHDGHISREDAESVAAIVLARHPVFSTIEVVDGGDSWNYHWSASDGEHDTPATKAEGGGESPFAGRSVTESTLAADLAAAGYIGPYTVGSTKLIRRRSASSGLPKLSVDDAGIVQLGPTASQLSAIAQPDWVPETPEVTYGNVRTLQWTSGGTTQSAGVGTSMEVSPLTSKGAPGSAVNNANLLWDVLRLRPEGGRTFWVQGHLLNQRLHGLGNEPRNLTPLSQADNQSHELFAERQIKAAVLRSGEDPESPTPPVVRYRVTITYGSRAAAPTTGPDPSVLGVLAAEATLATGLTAEAWYLQDDGTGRWDVQGEQLVSLSIPLASTAPPSEFVPRI